MEKYPRSNKNQPCKFGLKCKDLARGVCKYSHPDQHQDNRYKESQSSFGSKNRFPDNKTERSIRENQGQKNFYDQSYKEDVNYETSEAKIEKELAKLFKKTKLTQEDKTSVQFIVERLDFENFELSLFYKITDLLDLILKSDRADQSEFVLVIDQMGTFYGTIFEKFRDALGKTRISHKKDEAIKAAKSINSLIDFFGIMISMIPSCSVKFNIEHLVNFSKFFTDELAPKYFIVCLSSEEKAQKELLEKLKGKAETFKKMKQINDAKYSAPVQNVKPKEAQSNIGVKQTNVKLEEPEPTDNFREICIYPIPSDFQFSKGELRKNKSDEPFKNVQHYLDVHFRLFREDFYSAIRDGFEEYADTNNTKRNRHLRFSKGRISTFVVTAKTTGVNLVVYLPKNRKLFLNKRFIYGSMLIISHNQFYDYFICIVKNVDDKDVAKTIKEGFINVQVEIIQTPHSLGIKDIDMLESDFDIVETKAYFEPYYQVLSRLQRIQQLPLSEYIVECKFETNTSPIYLSRSTGAVDNSGRPITILHPEIKTFVDQWVKNPSYTFDKSQADAIQHIFNSKLSLIQGPPGTGKTYVGTHLVRILLKLKMKNMFTGPIFIICFTNHALDQFLEYLMEHTQNITRLGGRIKNEKLKPFTLQAKREAYKSTITKPRDYFRLLKEKGSYIKKFDDLKNDYESKFSFPFMTSLNMFTETEKEYFASVLEDYRYEYKWRLSIVSKNYKNQVKDFEKYYNNRFRGIPEFGLAVLFWLELLNFDRIINEWKIYMDTKPDSQTDENLENQVNEYEAQRALDQNNEENQYKEEDEDMKKQISTQSNIEFMNSEPLENPDKIYQTNSDLFYDLNQKHKARFPEGRQIYNKIYKQNENDKNSKAKKKFPNLTKAEKWILNNFFMNLKFDILTEISKLMAYIKQLGTEIDDYDNIYSRKLIENDDIIAMTTTGAAKYKNILNGINSKIIIVEEAAEVIESHITVSITPTTEHLVLIGDHMQLRPAVNDFILSKEFNLDISMFERLMNNKIKSIRIVDQRRMRPEISGIIKLLYPDLADDKKVLGRPDIKGFNSNVFFFNHNWFEDEGADKESKVNSKEANFVCKFAELLIKNGYKQDKITILSLYSGQLLYIKKEANKNNLLKDIRVATVDNFQGEENDIILLSLVRSNTQNKIGFLKVTNRVNVALSRAKLGLFIFGNAKCIREHELKVYKNKPSESFWINVLTYMFENNFIDDNLKFSCPRHKEEIIIKSVEDFQKCPNGGCKKICETRLECGHACTNFCHDYIPTREDKDGHADFKCLKPCQKYHKCGHPCGNLCSKCDPNKWVCKKIVNYIHPICGHNLQIPCNQTSDDPKNIRCYEKCSKTLNCGHACGKKCFEDCKSLTYSQKENGYVQPCEILVEYNEPCGHVSKRPCGQKYEEFIKKFKCEEKCGKLLKCMHPCESKCNKCFEFLKNEKIEMHDKCQHVCKKILICDHECQDVCTDIKYCSPCPKKCQVRCLHSYCIKDCGEVCISCIESCIYKCAHFKCNRRCFEICDRPSCNENCDKLLKCGHPCMGFCGEICPKICRTCDESNEAFEIFFGTEDEDDAKFVELDCGHSFEASGLDHYFKNHCQQGSLKYIMCPKCKQQVRFCMRYQAEIKTVTRNIDRVKTKIMQEALDIFNNDIKQVIVPIFEKFLLTYSNNKDLVGYIRKWLDIFKKSKMQINFIYDLHFSMSCVEMYIKIIGSEAQDPIVKKMTRLSEAFRYGCLELNSSDITKYRFKRFLKTLHLYSQILGFNFYMEKNLKDYPDSYKNDKELEKISKMSIDYTNKIESVDGFVSRSFFNDLNEFILNPKVKRIIIQKELAPIRQEIVKAIGLSSGHWFQCPNGHPYVIDNCGGAMQLSNCPDCGAQIGGQNHLLTSGNEHAAWIDGSNRPVFDEQAWTANLRLIEEMRRQNRFI